MSSLEGEKERMQLIFPRKALCSARFHNGFSQDPTEVKLYLGKDGEGKFRFLCSRDEPGLAPHGLVVEIMGWKG
jgi:hypothetical protein